MGVCVCGWVGLCGGAWSCGDQVGWFVLCEVDVPSCWCVRNTAVLISLCLRWMSAVITRCIVDARNTSASWILFVQVL